MPVTKALIRCSPLWVLKFMYEDMLLFAGQLAKLSNTDLSVIPDQLHEINQIKDFPIRQIVQQLHDVTICLEEYAAVNDVIPADLCSGDEAYRHAKTTWNQLIAKLPENYAHCYETAVTGYSDRNYSYTILLWNCAYQILLNEKDVYNDTFAAFITGLEELTNGNATYGDQRTQPLFRLIAHIGDFRISYGQA
jgi:hypothetical protein